MTNAEDDEVFASWDAMIDSVAHRSGMWVGRPKYSFVRCFVQGFGAGRGDDVLDGFQRWLKEQPQHSAVRNYAWWSLVLREVFDHGNEDDLAYPDEDALVIDHLFLRLREFLRLVASEEWPPRCSGLVREWDADEGIGVIDSPQTPGGCWAHFSVIAGTDGYRSLSPGQRVVFAFEQAGQDGFDYRAITIWPRVADTGLAG